MTLHPWCAPGNSPTFFSGDTRSHTTANKCLNITAQPATPPPPPVTVTSQKQPSPEGSFLPTLKELKNDESLSGKTKIREEYSRIIRTQIAILISSLSETNWKSHHDQVRYICDTEKFGYEFAFYEKLVQLVLQQPDRDTPTPLDRFFSAELAHCAKEIRCTAIILTQLEKGLASFSAADVIKFLNFHKADPVLAFVIVSSIADPNAPEVKTFFEVSARTVPALVLERNAPDDDWANLLLDCILRSPTLPFLHKLSTINQLQAFDSKIPPVLTFFHNILEMSFKDLLKEIGPENMLPAKLLPSLLQLKPDDVEESIALILAEVLIPGSQGLSGTNGGVTALTFVNNLPEANAKGAQLQESLKIIDSRESSLNWFTIFAKVQEYLFDASKRNNQPSIASVTQLFSALDFKQGLIDIFLTYEWWFDKTLLYMLQSMYTQQGAFDIMNSNNLTLCYEEEVNGEPEILKFVNIAKLEVQVMSKINAQNAQPSNPVSDGDKKLDTWLTQFFELHCRSEPHHVIAGALAIPDKNAYVLDCIDRLFAFMMDRPLVDGNLVQLGKVISKFKEFEILLAISKLIDYSTSRPTPESLSKVTHAALLFGLFEELLAKAKSSALKLYATFLVEGANNGYDAKDKIEAEIKNPQSKQAMYVALLEVLESRAAQDFELAQQSQNAQSPPAFKPLKVSVVYNLSEILKGSKGLIEPERLKNLQLSLLTTYPRLINFGTGHDSAILKNEETYSNVFPPEVESEMKTYYSKMYNKEMDIKDIVEMLTRMKTSDDPHDQDVFSCMIHSLIDEYRFFAEYPLTALASTSLLFGALLQKDLIQGTTLTVALNFIWESCNQPQDSHMFKFAIQSLYNFKSRLHEYPSYCKHLLQCQSLSAHAKMYQIVKDASNGIPCPDSNSQQGAQGAEPAQASRPDTITHVYNSISAVKKTVGLAVQEDPNESVSDKLLFFVNNMTGDNMLPKLAEVEDLFQEKYFSWFATYLVTERAKTEPNNHTLYSNMVFALKNMIFYEYVLNTTLFEVDKLLKNFKDTSTERSHLKNLGSWLGKITLANDRPLKRDQVALKYLLVEAFDFKTLHVVIPFVCKILEQASHSRIFRLPNPWVLGVIKVLVELYDCADLKLNLKFEIEVLLNAFDKKVTEIEPSTVVRTHNPNPEALAAMFGIRPEPNAVPDMSKLSIDGSDPSMMQQHLQQQAAMMQQQQQQQPQVNFQNIQQSRQPEEQTAHPTNHLDASFSNLAGNTIFTQNPNLRRAFQASLARSVRECAVPILSRVSEAVLTTTETLIRKDFATEGDSAKFRKSYQIMAQQLAHSMVICSGRKILSETIEATMIQLLGNQVNPSDIPLPELNLAIQSNVDLCVEIIENLAANNISELIEERMRAYVLARERRPMNAPFVDEGVSDYALQLPPPLGLQQDGLSERQLKIYSGFGTNSATVGAEQAGASQLPPGQLPQNLATPMQQGKKPQTPGTPLAGNMLPQPQDTLRNTSLPNQLASQQASSTLYQEDGASADQLFTVITQMCEKTIQMLPQTKETSLSELGADHPILKALTQTLSLCQSNAIKHPELLLKVAQYAVNCLFTQVHENPMSNEIYVVMLDKLCESSPSTAKDVTWWMVHSVDQRKFNMPVIFSLLKVQLVSPLRLDSSIGKLIAESNSPVLVKFAASLLLNVFSTEGARPIALRSEFGCTLHALLNYKPEDTEEHKQAMTLCTDLFELLSKTNAPALPNLEKPESEGYLQMGYIFAEWVKLLGHSEDEIELQNLFVDKLFHSGILDDPEKFKLFFTAATEIGVTAFVTEHEIRSRTQREVYLSIDCLAFLIVRIILRFNKDHSQDAIAYLKTIFGVIVSAMANDHEDSPTTWNERAYFKLFSSIMCVYCDASILDETATKHLDLAFYSLLGDVFNAIQPVIYPGFTFAWITLVGHRMFLPRLFELEGKQGYGIAVTVLNSLLRFQDVYSKDKEAHHDVINVIFKAITRLFTSLAHDVPEFLATCYYPLVTSVPSSYLQIKNIILSAVPKSVSAVSPFMAQLQVNDLPGCSTVAETFYNPFEDLVKAGLKKPVENYLRIPAPALTRAIYGGTKLNGSKETTGFGYNSVKFNTKVINALVLHVGNSAVEEKLPSNSRSFNVNSSHVSLIVDLLNQGNAEFKYHTIDAIANQLRFPNSTTQWFISLAVYMFTQSSIWSSKEVHNEVQEIMTRVLLERHLVNKPHPWGLSVLLTQLLSGQQCRFFDLGFVKNASPEMKSVFSALAKNVKA